MSRRIRYLAQALEHIETRHAWWRKNRSDAANQVMNEVDRLLELLQRNPHLGQLYSHRHLEGVHSVKLEKTPYRLNFVVDDEADEVVVLALHSKQKKRGPRLPRAIK